MEGEFPRDFGSLEAVFSLVDDFVSTHAIDESVHYAVTLAVEELFTNMVKYNPEGRSDLRVRLTLNESKLHVELIDADSRPFDVTQARNIDVRAGIEQRRPGGLGIFLVQKLMDDVRYDFKDGETRITLTKSL